MAATDKQSTEARSTPKKAPGGARAKAAAKRKSSTGTSTAKSATAGEQDAVQLLMADHREVAAMFERFEQLDDDDQKMEVAENICLALTVHTQIEEEIFYPAFLKATKDKDLNDEAIVEHQAAKNLIAQIEGMEASEDLYDAKVKVLGEEIEHHVKEEEQKDGMFDEAKKAKMDLKDLGRRMAARKEELMAELAGD